MDYIVEVTAFILKGGAFTLKLYAVTIVFAIPLGIVCALLKISRYRGVRWGVSLYTWVFRGTPLLLQLIFFYYGLVVFGISLSPFTAAALTFIINYGAYLTEIYRAGIESVDKGQYEAAVSVGMTPLQALYRIMLPQGAIIALPNFGNSLITLLKEGALAYTIGLVDLLGSGNLIIARNYGSYALEIYIALSVIYWGMAVLFEKVFAVLEQRLSRFKRPKTA